MHQAPPLSMKLDTMAISFVGIFLLIFLLGGLVLVAALLANRRTRPVALTMLGIFGIFALVMLGALFSFRTVSHARWSEHRNTFPHMSPLSGPLPPAAVESLPLLTPPQIVLDQAEAAPELIEHTTEIDAKESEVADEPADVPETEGEAREDASEASGDDEEKPESESEPPSTEETDTPAKPEAAPAPKVPDWIYVAPNSVGGVYRQVIEAGPWRDIEDCHRSFGEFTYKAIQKYVEEMAREELRRDAVYVPTLADLGISMNWIRQNVVCSDPQPYLQTTESSVGPMKTLYTQLEIDPNDHEFIRQRWRDYARHDRIAAVAAGGSFVLGGIGLLFGLLKIDTWTKGYYTKRLFLGVPAAIIGGIFLLMVWNGIIF